MICLKLELNFSCFVNLFSVCLSMFEQINSEYLFSYSVFRFYLYLHPVVVELIVVAYGIYNL